MEKVAHETEKSIVNAIKINAVSAGARLLHDLLIGWNVSQEMC